MSTLVLRPARALRPADYFFPVAQRRVVGLPDLFAAPGVALERDGEDGVLTVEAPGLDPERDLSVQVSGTSLTVAGTRRQTSGGVRREARFSRTVALPEGVSADAVSASYRAGVLSVRVAGMFPAPVQPETVSIAITSDVPAAPQAETEATPAEVSGGEQQAEQDPQAEQAPQA